MASTLTNRSLFTAVGALAAALALPVTAVADYYVPASQAGTVLRDGDGQCSLWEAIDSINNDQLAAGSGLHGCVNDFGGNTIAIEGNGARYRSGGAEISKPLSIYAYNPDYFAHIEHNGPFVLKVTAPPSSGQVYISGVLIQRTGGAKGRIIENTGRLNLDGVTIANGDVTGLSGSAGHGGGILNDGGILSLHASTVRNNRAEFGGGIWSTGTTGVDLKYSTVSTNTARQDGGGIFSSGRFFSMHNTISDNSAGRNGGGVFVTTGDNAYCDLAWSTVAFNAAAGGGGGVFVTITETDTRASIVAMNRGRDGLFDDYSGDPHGQACCPSGPGDISIFHSTAGILNLHKIGNDIIDDPQLLPLDYYDGGLTKTRAIPASGFSPALDAIPSEFCGPGGEELDQNFNTRPARGGCDIGAVERP